ncbi:MAG: VPDSG-CTERM sorting domain-containing protein [Opitutaceae bacterium]|nr:VPDSG-CTERM sorting domain-containing protein [Opitutaceae bacterium]
MKLNTLFSSAVLALGLGSVAHAATFTYNFTTTGGNVTSTSPVGTPAGAPSLTVTPAYYTGSSVLTSGATITQNGSYGYGVNNGQGDNSHAIDNSGYKDMLLFSFSASVSFSNLTLGWMNDDTDFRYWVGGSGATASSLFGTGSGGTTVNNSSINTPISLSGTGFTLLVAARPDQDNDAFKIKQLVVSYTTPPGTTGVPDSGATLILLGLGLLGLAGLKRRMAA